MASVIVVFINFKVKIELQFKEEMKKLDDSLVVKITKEVDDKFKEVREEFNQSIIFIEYVIYNEQYSRKNSVRIFGIIEEEGKDVE